MWREKAIIIISALWLFTFTYFIYAVGAAFILGKWTQLLDTFLFLAFLTILEIFVPLK
jgi:hypothetical protein